MAINNAALSSGGTCAVTGGTDLTFTLTGQDIKNGAQFAVASITDIRVRPTITVKSRPATVQPSGEWSRDQRELTITVPKVLANGKQAFPNVRITVNTYAESTPAEVAELCTLAAQTFFDTDFSGFMLSGSVA